MRAVIALTVALVVGGCASLPPPWVPPPGEVSPWRGKLESIALSADGEVVGVVWNGPDVGGVLLLSVRDGSFLNESMIRNREIAFAVPANDGRRALVETRCPFMFHRVADSPCTHAEAGAGELNFSNGAFVPVRLPPFYQPYPNFHTWVPSASRLAYNSPQTSLITLRSQLDRASPEPPVDLVELTTSGQLRSLGRVDDRPFQLLAAPMGTPDGAAVFGWDSHRRRLKLIRITGGQRDAREITGPGDARVVATTAEATVMLAIQMSFGDLSNGQVLMVQRSGTWAPLHRAEVPYRELPHAVLASGADVAAFTSMSSAQGDAEPRLTIDRSGQEQLTLRLADQFGVGRTPIRPIMSGAEVLRRLRAIAEADGIGDPSALAAIFGMQVAATATRSRQVEYFLAPRGTGSVKSSTITDLLKPDSNDVRRRGIELHTHQFTCVSPEDEILVMGQRGKPAMILSHGSPPPVREAGTNLHDLGRGWTLSIEFSQQSCAYSIGIRQEVRSQ